MDACGDQSLMQALRDNATGLNDHDMVAGFDGRESVGQDEAGAALAEHPECLLDAAPGVRVEGGGRVIQNRNRRVFWWPCVGSVGAE